MKALLLSFILAIGVFAHTAFADEQHAFKVTENCVGDNDFIYPENDELVKTSTFLQAGTTNDLILKAKNLNATYYVKFEAHYYKSGAVFGRPELLSVSPMPENSPYVASGLATKDDSLVRLQVPAFLGSHWQTVKVRIFGCDQTTKGRPVINSRLEVKVSSFAWSASIVVASIILLYIAATKAFHSLSQGILREAGEGAVPPNSYTFIRSLDPVVLTAGADGKGSLAKLQILFFSVIVCGLLSYVLLRSGELSDLSSTVLLLLGIAAVGSTAAKGAEQQNGRLKFENYAWLVKRHWLSLDGLSNNRASWRDIITSDGEFDVYRYQSCIFSLVVGGALVVVGVNQLASFQIPTTLLGVLGLSQAVYIAGKLVSPPAFSDLNDSILAVRNAETDLRAARAKLPGGALLTDPAIKTEYDKYMSAAKTMAVTYKSVTGLQPPEELSPSDEP